MYEWSLGYLEFIKQWKRNKTQCEIQFQAQTSLEIQDFHGLDLKDP